jgi:hypothetical protein
VIDVPHEPAPAEWSPLSEDAAAAWASVLLDLIEREAAEPAQQPPSDAVDEAVVGQAV